MTDSQRQESAPAGLFTLLATPVACLAVGKGSEGLGQAALDGLPYAVATSVIISLVVVWPGAEIRQQLRLRAASRRVQGPRQSLSDEIYKMRDLKAKLLS
jgi:hypothetical protein